MRNHLALLAVLVWPAIPLFWIPVHGFNRFFRKIGLLTYALPLVTWLPLAYLIYLKRMYLLSHTIFIPSALLLVGMIALVGGLLLQLWTLRLLSFRGITGMTEVSEKHPGRFVTRGPFSVVRHPTYLSHTMMLLGVFLITGVVTIAVVTVLDFFLIHAVVIPLEDRELLSRFGKEYMKYKREVPRFFPKFRLRRLDMGADELFQEGKKLFLEGKIEDSIDAFSKALDAGAEPGITFLSRGTAYLKLKNPDDALADFSRAVEAGRNNPKPYYFRGMAYTNKEDFEKAVADFSTAIELKPDYTSALFARGASYIRMNRLEEGGADIKNAVNYSEAAVQGYADTIGDRTHLDRVLAVLEGERRAPALAINDAEFEMIRKLLTEK